MAWGPEEHNAVSHVTLFKAPSPEAPPPGISLEEAHALQSEIERLEDEGTELRSQLAAKEDTNKKLSKHWGKWRRTGNQEH